MHVKKISKKEGLLGALINYKEYLRNTELEYSDFELSREDVDTLIESLKFDLEH